jgi:hypothetical protein
METKRKLKVKSGTKVIDDEEIVIYYKGDYNTEEFLINYK